MLQSDLNSNFLQSILYYIDQQISGRRYDPYATQCGTYSYDGSGNLQIDTWLIGDITQPSNSTLLSYTLSNIITFYTNKYANPYAILAQQPFFSITTTDRNNLETTLIQNGYCIYNSTAGIVQFWNGSAWVNIYGTL